MSNEQTIDRDAIVEAARNHLTALGHIGIALLDRIEALEKENATIKSIGNNALSAAVTNAQQHDRVKDLLTNALYEDAAHHKQWYLWRIVEALEIDLSNEWDSDYPQPEEGIAP